MPETKHHLVSADFQIPSENGKGQDTRFFLCGRWLDATVLSKGVQGY